jgi:hypothetical protein
MNSIHLCVQETSERQAIQRHSDALLDNNQFFQFTRENYEKAFVTLFTKASFPGIMDERYQKGTASTFVTVCDCRMVNYFQQVYSTLYELAGKSLNVAVNAVRAHFIGSVLHYTLHYKVQVSTTLSDSIKNT